MEATTMVAVEKEMICRTVALPIAGAEAVLIGSEAKTQQHHKVSPLHPS